MNRDTQPNLSFHFYYSRFPFFRKVRALCRYKKRIEMSFHDSLTALDKYRFTDFFFSIVLGRHIPANEQLSHFFA